MAALVGQIKNGRLYVRCWNCGDSENPTHAHCSITVEGLYYCVRCGKGGRLESKEFLKHITDVNFDLMMQESYTPTRWQAIYDKLLPGPGSNRPSALERYHLEGERGTEDVFLSRNAFGDTIGLAIVGTDRQRRMVGQKGLGYAGMDVLISTPDRPLRLVEGPYDVRTHRYVCCFGLPDRSAMQYLRGHFLILCPDGDVWNAKDKLAVIYRILQNYRDWIMGVEILPDGVDPDEAGPEDRVYIPIEKL